MGVDRTKQKGTRLWTVQYTIRSRRRQEIKEWEGGGLCTSRVACATIHFFRAFVFWKDRKSSIFWQAHFGMETRDGGARPPSTCTDLRKKGECPLTRHSFF